MKSVYLTLFLLIYISDLNGQTYSNSIGGPISDDNQYNYYPIVVSGLSSITLNTSSFGIESVQINITHTNDSDLRIKLQSPDGNVFVLTSFLGGTDDDYTMTQFTDTASMLITNGIAPFTGYFQPIDPLSNVNNGQNGNGTWSLNVRDQVTGEVGNVISWSITFGDDPAGYFDFTSSNLPIFVINTDGSEVIPDEPKIGAFMGIIDNGSGIRNYLTDPFNAYNNKIGIETRGASSQSFPQKSYGFETRDVNGTVKDTIVLGFPSEHDWILYAPYDDKTCIRNIISYDISNKMGHYASRTKLCELVLNGQYQGIYVLMEKIKVDHNRVDVAHLQPTEIYGDDLTGGYIVKIDKSTGNGWDGWTSNYLASTGNQINFLYHSPSSANIEPEQMTYIQQYIDSFETALSSPDFADVTAGYKKYASISSFIDYFILNEISKNVDGYRISTFLHKDKYSHGGKLKMGPVWDYNLAWWNADYCNGNTWDGWAYQFNDVCGGDMWNVPFWWGRFMEDPKYKNQLKCRWTELRQTFLSVSAIDHVIDSLTVYLDESQQRQFTKWPILGQYVWPNPSPIPADYSGEITALKNWVVNRLAWMDSNMPGICDAGINENELLSNNLNVYPNPFKDEVNILIYLTKAENISVEVYDLVGEPVLVMSQQEYGAGKNSIVINFSNHQVPNGMYLLKLKTSNGEIIRKMNKN